MMETKVEAEEVTTFLKLPVYTREGRYIGHVQNVFIDLDEKRIPVQLIDHALMGVFLAPGQHRVVCAFRPLSFIFGGMISLATLLFVAFWFIREWRKIHG